MSNISPEDRIDRYIQEIWPEVLKDIDTLVHIDSVEDLSHATPECPWGPAAKEALLAAMQIAERLGLSVTNVDNYLAFGDVRGNAEKDRYLATIAHSDIVPTGSGWHFPALALSQKDGYLIGRGVLDDKGPLVLSLWCAHWFYRKATSGEALPYTLRCIIGNNEETGMGDVEHYLKHYPEPLFCFSPDANFPLICGEKGVYHGQFTSDPIAGENLISLDGGTVANAIPSHAEALVRADASSLPEAERITVTPVSAATCRIEAQGIGGHASMPEGTLNAIGILVRYLLANLTLNSSEHDFLSMLKTLTEDTSGEALGIASSDEKFGALTCIAGTIRTEAGAFIQTVDSRYPTSTTAEAITARMEELGALGGCSYRVLQNMVPFYIDPASPEITALLSCYEQVSGNPGRAFVIGGGTYARHFKRACAFGPYEPSVKDPDWVGIEHGPDEGVLEESLKRALKIYIMALERLMELDFT